LNVHTMIDKTKRL